MSHFRERLVPPPSWWVGAIVFGAVWGWLVLVVSGPAAAVVVGLLLALVGAAAVWWYGARIDLTVDDRGLHVAGTTLAPEHVGPVEVLDAAAMRRWHGPQADARAWLVHRAYVPGGVRIVVDDPDDATPYWLLSSRRPHELQTALQTASAPQGDTDEQA